MAEQGSFWETLIGGTGEGPEAERKHKVLQYIEHRLKEGASLTEALEEDYVRRNCSQTRAGSWIPGVAELRLLPPS